MARAHPAWGCNRIETALRKQGISRSHNTVQNILNRAELGTQEKRWLDLDTVGAQHTAEQIEFIERFNPSYRDRAFRKTTPGALLFADAFKVGPFDSFSDGAIHVAIDSCSSFVSCLFHTHLTSGNAVWLIEKRAVPEFKNVGHRIDAVSTSSSRVFGPTVSKFLANNSIKSHSGRGMGRGYIERFKTAVEKDFVLGQVCDREFNDLKDLRTAFNEWWRAYNEAPLDGFPNFGKSPSAMLRKPAA